MLSSTLTLPGLIVKLSPAGCDLPCTALEVKGYLIVVPGRGYSPYADPDSALFFPMPSFNAFQLPAFSMPWGARRFSRATGSRGEGCTTRGPWSHTGGRGSIIGSGGGSGSIDAQPLLEPLQEVVELVLLLRHSLTCWA